MRTALEVELKAHAHNKVGVHLKYEYDSQIDSKWKPHINLMVDAQTAALNRHQKVLNDVRKQIEKEQQAASGLAMLALSLVAGPVLSWVAGKIQYNWLPKFASEVSQRKVKISYGGIFTPMTIRDLDHDKVWAKVFGDLGNQVVGLGIAKALKVVTPNSNIAKNAIQTAASSDQASFRTSLENALLAEARLTSDAIMSLANSIDNNDDYGAECLQKLKASVLYPRAREVTEKELSVMAKKMIIDDIDEHRQKWANEWFYYGYDPGTTMGMAESIELEMWALWILNEQLKVAKHYRGSPDNPMVSAEILVVEGATFGDRGVPELVLQRLAEFGVVEARTQLQKLRAIAARGVKEQQDAAAARAARNRRTPPPIGLRWIRRKRRCILSWHASKRTLPCRLRRINVGGRLMSAKCLLRRIRIGR